MAQLEAEMWSEPDFPYPEMESAYRPVLAWQRRPPRYPLPYARPPDVPPPFMKPDINMLRMGIPPPFRMSRIPLELVTPHAGPGMPPAPLRPIRPSNVSLYQDFSAPPRPTPINISVQTSALKCNVEWKSPAVSSLFSVKSYEDFSSEVLYPWFSGNAEIRIQIRSLGRVKCDTYDFPAHILSYKLRTTPGTLYKLELSARDANNTVVAVGTTCMKAVFSADEMQALYKKSLDFVGTVMHSFRFLYRCKPKIYYDDIQFHRGGIMEKYMKDNNGQAASSINGAISVCAGYIYRSIFSARLLPDGSLPTHSPFGNVRMLVPAMTLLDPARVNMYFCDFYCNYITHYVTVVICEKHSDRLIKLAPDSNPFLRIVFRPPMFEPEFWVNKNVWVEIYYTENVPLNWGRFDAITATGAGTSRVGGLPHNKQCQLCNLYPQKSSSVAKIASTKLNSTFELLLHLERKRFGNENISESADLIETICSVIDSVVEQCSQNTGDENNKQENDNEERGKRKLESPEEIMQRLDGQDLCEEMQDAVNPFVSCLHVSYTHVSALLEKGNSYTGCGIVSPVCVHTNNGCSLLSMDYTDFMEWVTENGAQHFGVIIRDCVNEGGKGLFATTDFRENETVICIPVEIIITAGYVAELPAYCDVFTRYRLKPFEALVYFFLMEKEQDSKWTPYLKVLPKSFSTPANLHPNLEPEDFPYDLRKQWYRQKNELKIIYEKFVMMLADSTIWDHFLWAWHIVNTRCIHRDNKPHPLIDDSEGDSLAIVPLIDILNHSNNNQCCAIWDSKLNQYKVIATRPIHEGEQIFICYGSHTNGSLWIEYEDFMRLANIAGISFSDLHRQIVLQANFPCFIYATDVKPNFGFKANLALLKMSCSKLRHWAKVIYEEAEAITNDDVLVIVRLLQDEMVEDGKKSPKETQWLWTEQTILLHTLLTTV
ncbi:Phytanoyl-CoA hydroxylase-interacting protein-like [Dirofilaria immitis]|nr:Phytanoyl-CoA hydroxylase-interacting protein-like [Dirofilaria immitis]